MRLFLQKLSSLVATTYFRVHHTIIGLGAFHCCVRNGNRWDNSGIIATTELNVSVVSAVTKNT